MRQLLGSSPCGRASATLTQGSNGLASAPGGHELEFLLSSTEESGDEPATARGAALRGAVPRGAVPRGAAPLETIERQGKQKVELCGESRAQVCSRALAPSLITAQW